MPDGISLLSVCTLAMREWGPGTVSARSHSNLEMLLWGLSLLLPSGFRASHTETHTRREIVAAYDILTLDRLVLLLTLLPE